MPLTAARLAALTELAALLAPTARGLAAGLALAARRPDVYYRRHAKRLADRNVDAPGPSLPWLALIDGLRDARALVEIDWKTEAADVAWAIGMLRGVPRGAMAWMTREPGLEERSTLELLELTGQRLRARGLQLAALDLDSDSHALVVVERGHTPRLVSLASKAGFGAATSLGDDLAAATRGRIARDRRHAAEQRRQAARDARRPKPKLAYFAKGKTCWWIASHDRNLQCAFEAPGYRYYVGHRFPSPAAMARGKRAQLAAWKAAGFRALSAAQAAALPASSRGYVWIAPFPAKARYFVEGTRLVRALLLDGDTTWQGSGAIGRSFAAIQQVVHHPTPEAAAAHHAHELANHAPLREVTRARIVALYAKQRR